MADHLRFLTLTPWRCGTSYIQWVNVPNFEAHLKDRHQWSAAISEKGRFLLV